MLAPDSRSVLFDQLRPDPGFELVQAVGTTFTLGLESALVPPLALAAGLSGGHADPIAMLSALRDVADRIDIFCQAGQIGVPRTDSTLLAYLEPVIHQVGQPRRGRLFHPKVWVCKYQDESGAAVYRLLVLSRNLTAETTWDTVVRIDGHPGTKVYALNRPLRDFVNFLPTATVHPLAPAREDRIHHLAEDIRRVDWDLPDGMREMTFHPLGIPGSRTPDFSGYRNLVVSPFLTRDGLNLVAPGVRPTVVSRGESLEALDPDQAEGVTSFVLDPAAGLPRDDDSVGVAGVAPPPSGLHAKFYVAERNRLARLIIGSANATFAAFHGNIEFCVEFAGPTTLIGIDALMKSFGPILLPYEAGGTVGDDEDHEAQRRLDQAIRTFAAIPARTRVDPSEPNGYRETVTTTEPVRLPSGYSAQAELHTRRGIRRGITPDEPLNLAFDAVPLTDVTAFVCITVTSPEGLVGRSVLLAPLINEPPDRLDAILADQLDTPEKFLRFLMLLLSINDPNMFGTLNGSAGAGDTQQIPSHGPGLFERLVRAIAVDPEAFAGLRDLIEQISRDAKRAHVMPDGFADLWAVFDQAQRQLDGVAP